MGKDGSGRQPEIRLQRIARGPRRGFQYYGRRQGHRLRPGRKALLAARLPSLRLPPHDDAAALDEACAELAAHYRDIWLEIGFGGGEHLLDQACRHPDVAIVGAEPFINGVARVVAAVDEHGIGNLRLVDDDIRPWLENLPENTFGRVFILFPDPWPKTRHHKRRIVTEKNLDRLARLMRDDAELRIASDDMSYVRWVLELATAHPAFDWAARGPADWRQRPADAMATRYEEKARRAGRACVFLTFVRRRRRLADVEET